MDKHDNEERKIIFNDVPERFQARKIPVTTADEEELRCESTWIRENAFETSHIISEQASQSCNYIYYFIYLGRHRFYASVR